MILEPSLPFMSFRLEGLFETSTRNDRFLWKKRLSAGITGVRRCPAAGNAIAGRAKGFSSVGITVVGSRTPRFGNHGACAGDTVRWVDRSRRIWDGRTEKLVAWCGFDWIRGVGVGARNLGSDSDKRLVAVGYRVHAAERHGRVDPGWARCRRRSYDGGWNPARHRSELSERDDDGSSGPELRLRAGGNSDDAGAGRAFHAFDAAADAGPGQRTDQRGSTRGS